MKVFIDANIFVDILHTDRTHHQSSIEAYRYLIKHEATILTSCDLMTTIYYLDAKRDKRQALFNIKKIAETLRIINFSNEELDEVCQLMIDDASFSDLEDTLQYLLAKKHGCDLILSNDKGFVSKEIALYDTVAFCQKMGAEIIR